jgi:hypothetical protein
MHCRGPLEHRIAGLDLDWYMDSCPRFPALAYAAEGFRVDRIPPPGPRIPTT